MLYCSIPDDNAKLSFCRDHIIIIVPNTIHHIMSLTFPRCADLCIAVNTYCGSYARIAVLIAICPQVCLSCINNSLSGNSDEIELLDSNEW